MKKVMSSHGISIPFKNYVDMYRHLMGTIVNADAPMNDRHECEMQLYLLKTIYFYVPDIINDALLN